MAGMSRGVALGGVLGAFLSLSGGARMAERPAASALGCDDEAVAVRAADTWLQQVDAGRYAESWAAASSLLTQREARSQWEDHLAKARGPFGHPARRRLAHSECLTALPGLPGGPYVLLRLETSFKSRRHGVETLTAVLDPDGAWRVAGYEVR